MPQTTLDPQLVNLAKAIRQTESGGNFQAQGKSGEYGAYQFMPQTWAADSKAILGTDIPANKATPEQQNEVAYKSLEAAKKAHPDWNVGQFASWWNSGSPDNYQNGHAGTNAQGVQYDTPAYAKKVAEAYQQIKGQGNISGGYNPTPFSSGEVGLDKTVTTAAPAAAPSFTQEAGQDIGDAATGVAKAASDTASGKINPLSGLLQGGGAIAGGITSLANTAATHLPVIGGVIKGAENLASEGIGKLAQTAPGQAVAKGVSDFSTAHPELSADIGGAANIASVIPLFKGVGLAKDALGAAAGGALKDVGEKAVGKEISEVASRTVGGRKTIQQAAASGHDPVKILSKKEFQPAIEDGKYSTATSQENLDEAISKIDEEELQPALDKGSTGKVSDQFPLSKAVDEAKAAAVDAQEDTGAVERYFDRIRAKFGDFPTLKQLNEAKRTVSHKITESGYNSPDYSTYKIIRNTLQKAVEDGAKSIGSDDVNEINGRMAALIKAQQLLKSVNGKSAKSGLLGKIGREGIIDAATAGGEAAGNAAGIPFAGALMGRGAGGLVSKAIGRKNVGGILGSFSRTGK